MERRADLHIHTTASDGAFTPAQVVEVASSLGLAAIAVTDHDTVDGVDDALAAGRQCGVEVIPSVEISTMHQGRTEVHILGYFIDHRNADLVKFLRTLKDARRRRAVRMVEQLNAAGVPVTFERVAELANGGSIGRPHVARAICEVQAASSMNSAFGRFLQEGGPGYVPRYKIEPVEAVQIITHSGGVACCAHAAKLKRDELLLQLLGQGMAAIEVWHPDHTAAGARFYQRFAESRGLIATGGSDAHCFEGAGIGTIGQVTVPYEVVEQLKRASDGGTAA